MKINQNVCSKLWTDLNINFNDCMIRHCCKQSGHFLKFDEIDSLGKDVFEKYNLNLQNKKSMIEDNIIPDSCGVCKENNDNSIKHIWNQWSDKKIKNDKSKLLDKDYTNYIELTLGTTCDLTCVYCGPHSSTAWEKYLNLTHRNKNEKLKEIWKYKILDLLEEKINSLPKNLQITFNLLGGEPLLMQETYHILDKILPILKTWKKKPEITFTTNLNAPEKLIKKLINKINNTSNYITWSIGVSIEDINNRAELIRYGLNWKRFNSNLQILSKYCKIYLLCTQNYLNLPFFDQFLQWAKHTMSTNYKKDWDFVANCVYDNFLDPAFLTYDQIDFSKIYKELDTFQDIDMLRDHLQLIEKRVGSKKVNIDFINFYKNMILSRNDTYLLEFPHLKKIINV